MNLAKTIEELPDGWSLGLPVNEVFKLAQKYPNRVFSAEIDDQKPQPGKE